MYTMQSHSYQLATLPLPQYPAGANSPWLSGLSGLSHSDINSYHGRWFSRPIRSFCSFSAVRSKSGSVRGLAASAGYPLICGQKNCQAQRITIFTIFSRGKSSRYSFFPDSCIYPLVNCHITMERSTMLLMGKSTISTGPFSIANR